MLDRLVSTAQEVFVEMAARSEVAIESALRAVEYMTRPRQLVRGTRF